MLSNLIKKLMQHHDLTAVEATQLLETCLHEETDPYQVVAALVLLHAKGETAVELYAMREVLQKQMLAAPTDQSVILDIVGTGGDSANTFNISTSAAILAASCGAHVAKHGNRAVSSQCGSADLIAALGVPLDLSAEQIATGIDECGFGFYYAPHFHVALQKLREIRKRLRVPTAINLLGPLLNPTHPTHYLCGVAKPKLVPIYADVFALAGKGKALVFNGHGVDELTCVGPTEAILIENGEKKPLNIVPSDYGLKSCTLEDLRGGDAAYNVKLLHTIFGGQTGPLADTIALNAGVALFVCGIVENISEGVQRAKRNLENGTANTTLLNWIDFTTSRKQNE